jgi:Bardet-Biedl syndrome 1 protein
LVVVGRSGSIYVRMLPRLASLKPHKDDSIRIEDKPIPLAKKTRLFVEQMEREKKHAADMHRIFQRDLVKLRLATARSYVKSVQHSLGPQSYALDASIRVNADVNGLGPLFKIRFHVQNTGKNALYNVPVCLSYDQLMYRVKRPLFTMSCLVPGLDYTDVFTVETLETCGLAGKIEVFVCHPKSHRPLLTVVINMPPCDATLMLEDS